MGTSVAPAQRMALERILALTDLSLASRPGLTFADSLAARTGGRVDVGYVSRPLPGLPREEEALAQRLESRIESEETAALEERVRSCVAAPRRGAIRRLSVECVRCGIRDLLSTSRPDVVCLSVRGTATAPDLLVGSIAEYVARAAEVPVFLVRAERLPPPREPLRVLLAADLVEPPTAAVRRIRWLVGPEDDLTLAHVIHTPVYFPPALGVQDVLTPGRLDEVRRSVAAALANVDVGADAPRLRTHVAEGHPGEALVDLARTLAPHVVAVRTHAARPFDPAMPGPVCEYLVRRCPATLLVLPKRG